jgi:hypothetical protein
VKRKKDDLVKRFLEAGGEVLSKKIRLQLAMRSKPPMFF